MEKLTPLLIVALPLAIGILDVILYKWGGNEATISWVMLSISFKQPLVPLSVFYSFAVLMGHCFFPEYTHTPPPAYEVVARMFLVLSPAIYSLIIIGAGNGSAEANRTALRAWGEPGFALWMVVAALVGLAAGHYGLPQHLPPPE